LFLYFSQHYREGVEKLELVFGMKDVYPWEAKVRRSIEARLRTLFERWGYAEVEPPTLEYYATFEKTMSEEMKERIFKFLNRDGKLVCLRPEFTTSVARMFAQGNALPLPLRVYYSGKVFRYPSSPFRTESEFTQVGLEHIGQSGSAQDAEIITLAILALRETGIRSFEVDIGHAGIFRGILEVLPLKNGEKEEARIALKKRDFVALQTLCSRKPLPSPLSQFLLQLPFLRGKRDLLERLSCLSSESEEWQRAVWDLLKTWEILEDFGMTEHLSINLGLVRDFDYYTGVVFEGFSPGVGYPLLAGGRYDELFRVFGKDVPACGFALFLERVLEALQKETAWQEGDNATPSVLFYPPRLRRRVFELAEKLRSQGIPLVMEEHEEETILLITPRGSSVFEDLDEQAVENLLTRRTYEEADPYPPHRKAER
jgi:ATP phosphoribosyltransferase regulatory subunit